MTSYEGADRAELGRAIATRIEDARTAYYDRLDEVPLADRIPGAEEYAAFDDCDACVAREALVAVDEYLAFLAVVGGAHHAGR